MRARLWIAIWAVSVSMPAVGSTSWAQQQTIPTTGTTGRQSTTTLPQGPNFPPVMPGGDFGRDYGGAPSQMREEQAKMRNIDRQKQLVSDTEKLLALANELKTDVDKTSKDTLSVDVIRKADEIEKLAHSVKEKMKGD